MGFGSFGGGLMSAGLAGGLYAGNKSASAQRGATAAANDRLLASKNEAIGYLDPYSDVGRKALSPLTALLLGQKYDADTGNFSEVNDEERMSNFLQSPGYQFRLTEGMRAIEKSQAVKGNLLSGGGMKDLMSYGQGLASDEYNNYLNSLFQMAGIGQQADTNKGNYAIGTGANMANMAYNGGMANSNKYANLSNAMYGMAGIGASSGLGGGSSGSGGDASRYNSAYNLQNFAGGAPSLMMGG